MAVVRKMDWNTTSRKDLQNLLLEGYTVGTIAGIMKVSNQTIYNEIKRGTTAEEYKLHQYIKYTPEKVVENYMRKILGEDQGDGKK